MSSRLGNVTRGLDVVEAVREKVRELVQDESLVNDVTIGAIKYAFARYRLGGDIAFDLDETVSLQGTLALICSMPMRVRVEFSKRLKILHLRLRCGLRIVHLCVSLVSTEK